MNDTAGDVRGRILMHATRLFGQKGFGGTSVRELVDAAGVTKPTLYYYFENKDALFLEAVQVQLKRLELLLSSLDDPGLSVGERLRTFVRGYIREGLANPDGLQLIMTAQHPVSAGQPEVDLLSVHQRTIEHLAGLLSEGEDAGVFACPKPSISPALSLLGACHLHLVAAMHGMPMSEDLADQILDLFLNGVMKK